MNDERTSALLLVDVQNDFCPGGALAVERGDEVVPVLNRLAARAGALGWPIYASRDWHPPDSRHFAEHGGRWPAHCVAQSAGARLHPALQLPAATMIVTKGQTRDAEGYSAFDGTVTGRGRFADDLQARGVTHLVVGGLATDYCVVSSVLDALGRGFDVTVVEDAIRAVNLQPDDGARAVERMRTAGAEIVQSRDL